MVSIMRVNLITEMQPEMFYLSSDDSRCIRRNIAQLLVLCVRPLEFSLAWWLVKMRPAVELLVSHLFTGMFPESAVVLLFNHGARFPD